MSATESPRTFSDLYTALLNAMRAQTGVTATDQQAKRYINIGLQDMHMSYREKFPWAERQDILRTQAEYTTGTITITQGSTTLTGSSTVWTTTNAFGVANARAGGKVLLGGQSIPYEVSAVGGAGTITLATRYIGEDLSADTYIYFEDEYDLATDFMRPLDQQNFDTSRSVALLGRNEFRMRYPNPTTRGKPFVATIIDKAPVSGGTTLRRRVKFWRPPDDYYLLPYSYITKYLAMSSTGTAQESLSADADEPIVPFQYRYAIVLKAKALWFSDRKDDVARAQAANAEYVDYILRVVQDHEIGSNRPQMRPRLGGYISRARRPWRGGTGRYDINGRFDRMEDV